MNRNGLCAKLVLILSLSIIPAIASFTHADARTYICKSNPDYFSKRCTIHPYAVTKRVDGQDHKGHLVGCQFKTYTCIDGICRDNYGFAEIPFEFSMDDYAGFCSLLCRNPECFDPDGWQ
ncbi:MAG: hypothetical protein C4576_05930 [Desulfobacteraceae bacterium]|nr:MAG: hypothetical protein C4576_05930 [Desulfobacteraceae bacterium]